MALIPFDSLFFYLLAIAVILSPANLLACMITFVGSSLLSHLLVGSVDALGNGLLMIDVLQPFYRTIIEWPFVAWTRFNNTVVLGGLVVGAIGAVPLYLMARLTYRPLHRWLESRCGKEETEMESFASSSTSTP